MTLRLTLHYFLCIIFTGCLTAGVAAQAVDSGAHVEAQSHIGSPGKPNAGLAVTDGRRHQLQVGNVQTLTLGLSSESNGGLLGIEVSSDSTGLELLSPTHHQFELAREPNPILTLDVMPHQPGQFYLKLKARLEREGVPVQEQSLVVLVEVGGPQLEQQSRKTTPAPEVISLPAQERIYRQ